MKVTNVLLSSVLVLSVVFAAAGTADDTYAKSSNRDSDSRHEKSDKKSDKKDRDDRKDKRDRDDDREKKPKKDYKDRDDDKKDKKAKKSDKKHDERKSDKKDHDDCDDKSHKHDKKDNKDKKDKKDKKDRKDRKDRKHNRDCDKPKKEKPAETPKVDDEPSDQPEEEIVVSDEAAFTDEPGMGQISVLPATGSDNSPWLIGLAGGVTALLAYAASFVTRRLS